jgi:hypothetical protein
LLHLPSSCSISSLVCSEKRTIKYTACAIDRRCVSNVVSVTGHGGRGQSKA